MTVQRTQLNTVLFEALRSFSTLASTLNLSRAVDALGTTRQTVRRHISLLEEARGEELFELIDRQYVLTKAGQQALPEAEAILFKGEAWIGRMSGHVNGLQLISFEPEGEFFYHLQQHPVSRIWTHASTRLSDGVRAWVAAEGQLEHAAFDKVRPNALVFRYLAPDWVCTEIGEESDFAKWYGWAWARSSVGQKVQGLPGGPKFNYTAIQSYEEMRMTQGLRYDHVVTKMPHGPDNTLRTICFERVLMGCRFPDQTFAMVSIVHRTADLEIEGVDPAVFQSGFEEE